MAAEKTNRDFLNKLQLRTARIIEGRKVERAGGTFLAGAP